MTVLNGDIYERNIRKGHEWRTERRLVLDTTDSYILYEIIYNDPEGTHVESEPIQVQSTRKEWSEWTKLARKIRKSN